MDGITILYPLLGHMLLVISLYILLITRKSKAIKAKAVDFNKTALNNKAWPEDVVQVSNNLDNQFESPLVFYGLCIITVLVGAVNSFAIGLSVAYVVFRYIHAYVHVGTNYIPHRLRAFALSLVVMLILLIQTSVQIVMNL
ncbi:MAPEG family protein [Moritella sp. F3]|uniref:MAPEG family protein n=1 Tax=Moritella sp. F3 TaxID=2718882 RepID=UPI0018E182D6|nr:MAPEG family protein [Moritella sp. F3]GIC76986.1 membrane protein [Moritella sp. F1]GIC80169.1 membrane protein [Moritella sp. F3]